IAPPCPKLVYDFRAWRSRVHRHQVTELSYEGRAGSSPAATRWSHSTVPTKALSAIDADTVSSSKRYRTKDHHHIFPIPSAIPSAIPSKSTHLSGAGACPGQD